MCVCGLFPCNSVFWMRWMQAPPPPKAFLLSSLSLFSLIPLLLSFLLTLKLLKLCCIYKVDYFFIKSRKEKQAVWHWLQYFAGFCVIVSLFAPIWKKTGEILSSYIFPWDFIRFSKPKIYMSQGILYLIWSDWLWEFGSWLWVIFE